MRLISHASYFFVIAYSLLSVFLLSSLIPSDLSTWDWQYFLTSPTRSGKAGGILSILVGTFLIWSLSLLVSFVVGTATAIFTYEMNFYSKSVQNWMLAITYVITGIPSIVFGLLGNRIFVVELGWGYSILSGLATISMMMIPLVTLSLLQGFEQIDKSIYRNSVSLMLSKKSIYLNILLPYLRPSIYAGLSLASARVLAETAALLFTSGYSDRMPSSIMDSSRTLTVHIYDLMTNVVGGESKAKQSAFVLLLCIFLIQFLLYIIFQNKKRFKNV